MESRGLASGAAAPAAREQRCLLQRLLTSPLLPAGGGGRRHPQAKGADTLHRPPDRGEARGQSEADQGDQELRAGHQPRAGGCGAPCGQVGAAAPAGRWVRPRLTWLSAGEEAGGVAAPGNQSQRGQGRGGEDQGSAGGSGRHRGPGVGSPRTVDRSPRPGRGLAAPPSNQAQLTGTLEQKAAPTCHCPAAGPWIRHGPTEGAGGSAACGHRPPVGTRPDNGPPPGLPSAPWWPLRKYMVWAMCSLRLCPG